jgi:hypothetical protein
LTYVTGGHDGCQTTAEPSRVVVDGNVLKRGTDYIVRQNYVMFTSAPATGAEVELDFRPSLDLVVKLEGHGSFSILPYNHRLPESLRIDYDVVDHTHTSR